MGFKVADVEREAEQNPYQGGVTLIARAVRELLNEPQQSAGYSQNGEFVSFAEDLWRQARRAALWWTPARVEEEGLRRAGDDVSLSTIAREHHLFSALYLRWLDMLIRWGPLVDIRMPGTLEADATLLKRPLGEMRTSDPEATLLKRALYLRDAIGEVLGLLERKGAAAESRAMDIRLRLDHEKITRLIAGHELVSRLQELVDLAARGTEGQKHLRALVEQLVVPISNAAKELGSIENAVDFACDKLVQHQPKERGRLKAAAAILVTAAASSGTKVFFERLIELLAK